MSDTVFGNPWHGTLGPDGLTLADTTVLETCPLEGYTAGTYFPPVGGHAYYYKKPGLPAPATPDHVAGFGGEFKDDFVLFSGTKRYSPFCETALLGANQWLHLGSDGQWRKMELVVTAGPAQYTTVEVRRRGLFGQINVDTSTENALIATLTLESPILLDGYNSFVLGDNKFDGSSVVCFVRGNLPVLRDRASILAGVDIWGAVDGIVAAWTISVSGDATTASATNIYSLTTPDEEIVVPSPHVRSTGGKYWVTVVVDEEKYWLDRAQWRVPGQCRSSIYDAQYQCQRMIGAGWTAAGSLELLMYHYDGIYVSAHSISTGTFVFGGEGYSTPLWYESPAGVYNYLGPGDPYDFPGEWTESIGTNYLEWSFGGPPGFPYETVEYSAAGTYDIKIQSNAQVLKALAAIPSPTCYATQVTNSVFSLRNSGQSILRVAPGAIDDTPISGSFYAAFNPRAGVVTSSVLPIGFV